MKTKRETPIVRETLIARGNEYANRLWEPVISQRVVELPLPVVRNYVAKAWHDGYLAAKREVDAPARKRIG